MDLTPADYSTDVDEVFLLSAFPIAAGNYTLTVQGTPALSNSAFSGQLVFNAAIGAVPEPATWAMMMLGMGAVGFALRRNRSAARAGERRLSFA